MKIPLLAVSLAVTAVGLCHLQAQTFTNADFEAGNLGFATDYVFADANSDEGQFTVRSDPENWNVGFTNFGDHTTTEGKMLVVNGATDGSPVIWRQTISVQTNTWYRFQIWTGTAVGGGPAVLVLKVGGVQIGLSFLLPDEPGTWKRWEQAWISTTNSTATFEVVNANTSRFPNDFYLDDVGLKTAPELFVSKEGGEVELRWEADPAWELVTSSSIVGESWIAVTDLPSQSFGLKIMRLPMNATHAFFQLRRIP